jgi:hypothetical protein
MSRDRKRCETKSRPKPGNYLPSNGGVDAAKRCKYARAKVAGPQPGWALFKQRLALADVATPDDFSFALSPNASNFYPTMHFFMFGRQCLTCVYSNNVSRYRTLRLHTLYRFPNFCFSKLNASLMLAGSCFGFC